MMGSGGDEKKSLTDWNGLSLARHDDVATLLLGGRGAGRERSRGRGRRRLSAPGRRGRRPPRPARHHTREDRRGQDRRANRPAREPLGRRGGLHEKVSSAARSYCATPPGTFISALSRNRPPGSTPRPAEVGRRHAQASDRGARAGRRPDRQQSPLRACAASRTRSPARRGGTQRRPGPRRRLPPLAGVVPRGTIAAASPHVVRGVRPDVSTR
jgi:hypothetical protein